MLPKPSKTMFPISWHESIAHADNIISVTITLSVEKVNQKAEADAHLAGKDLHVEAIEQDMYAAIDVLMDKLDRAVLKHKEKSGDVRSTVNLKQNKIFV